MLRLGFWVLQAFRSLSILWQFRQFISFVQCLKKDFAGSSEMDLEPSISLPSHIESLRSFSYHSTDYSFRSSHPIVPPQSPPIHPKALHNLHQAHWSSSIPSPRQPCAPSGWGVHRQSAHPPRDLQLEMEVFSRRHLQVGLGRAAEEVAGWVLR